MNAKRFILMIAVLLSVSVGMTANAAPTETGRENYLVDTYHADAILSECITEEMAVVTERPALFEFDIVQEDVPVTEPANKVISEFLCPYSDVRYRARDKLIRQCFATSIYNVNQSPTGIKSRIINRAARIRML
jgi:hypothetical protein